MRRKSIDGYRKVYLERQGITLSTMTVRKYRNTELGLMSVVRRKRPESRRGQAHKVFPNVLEQCRTINLDYRLLVHHFEYGVWMYDTDCIGDMKADFLEIMARSEEMRPDRVLLRGWERLPAEMMKVFSPLF